MVYLKRYILCAAPLAFIRLQSFHQAVAPIVLDYSCYYIGIAAFHFGIPAKTVVVEQHFTNFAIFLRVLHNKVFPLAVLANITSVAKDRKAPSGGKSRTREADDAAIFA